MNGAVSTIESDSDILRELFEATPDSFYVNQKSEAGKVRAVVKVKSKIVL